MARSVVAIDAGWEFRQADKDDSPFLPVSQFPTNIHLDLLHHGLIPDPFVAKNELDVQWVGEAAWTYRTTFASPAVPAGARAVLAFDGLDTFATVKLNGATILESDNMFLPYRVDVSAQLAPEGSSNELSISFDSAYLRGCELVEKYPAHKWGCWNGDTSRLAVRKAQYHWGWDWGPTLLTCGPWRPIHLEVYEARVADLAADVDVDASLSRAAVAVTAELEGSADQVRFELSLDGRQVAVGTADANAPTASFTLENPSLWYPRSYGAQPLYEVRATLLRGGAELDTAARRIGIRRARLVQRPLEGQPGTSFFFEVNNVPVFCGGSNWIPADSFIPRIAPKRYYDWVRLVAEGNQGMLRVWGGGIYEEEDFYNACDEIGILVWQDFMFGCGNYPAWPELRASIDAEARANLRRLRHHPSIVIWAGNNEDYQYQESAGLTYDYADKDAEGWLKTDFPARYIYEKILADACAALAPRTAYHPGSPWGAGRDTHDGTVGDIHQWNVWHGTQEKWQDFDKLVGRFVSEFGMQAFPSVKTIDAYLPQGRDDPDRYAQSSTVDFHNKADGHERRIALYLAENLRYAPDPLEQYVYSTQLMQAECLASAYRLWRREWRGPSREYCAGALVWQINDCWPVTSWSIADYYLRPKHAYFTVKREMAPITVGIARRTHKHPVPGAHRHSRIGTEQRTRIEVWGSNLTLSDATVDCVLRAWDVVTGEETFSQTVAAGLVLGANRSTEVVELEVPVGKQSHEPQAAAAARTVVAAYLVQDGRQVARYVNWPEPLKHVHLQQPKALEARLAEDLASVRIRAEVPVKGVALECDDDGVAFDDNLIDVVPGEVVTVAVRGASAKTSINTRYLGMQ
ncbi:hypothetical protein VTJ83DRAFT_171 [Remersonia thermophila]|uniref:Beta-mannosidase B n=1 Tax=Remersonia thermophila TaxID=72144 RepID=A0ABR4DK94_9PEZI